VFTFDAKAIAKEARLTQEKIGGLGARELFKELEREFRV
jgi:hypothetical protein